LGFYLFITVFIVFLAIIALQYCFGILFTNHRDIDKENACRNKETLARAART